MFHYVEKTETDNVICKLPGPFKRAMRRYLDLHRDEIIKIKCNMKLELELESCIRVSGGFAVLFNCDAFDENRPEVSDNDMDIVMYDKLKLQFNTSLSDILVPFYIDSMSVEAFDEMTARMNCYSLEELEVKLGGE